MRILARSEWFNAVVHAIREALPEFSSSDAVGIAEGNIELDESRVERILAKMPNPDELCELV